MAGTSDLAASCEMKTLLKANVRMKNAAKVQEILKKLQAGGKEKLQVILDFDRTLTKPHVNGIDCLSSYGIFNLCPSLSQSYLEETSELYARYRPFEMDMTLPREERATYSQEWTMKKSKLLNFVLDPMELDIAVEKANVPLRDGADKLLQSLSDQNVPVLVFSGGLSDTVTRVLDRKGVLYSNTHVIANILKYEEGNQLNGFRGNHITAFNKNETVLQDTEYFHELAHRNNVILMGDCVGDADMADGVQDLDAILKIGFLQYFVDEYLPEYMEHFDIVLINDMSMDVANEILESIK